MEVGFVSAYIELFIRENSPGGKSGRGKCPDTEKNKEHTYIVDAHQLQRIEPRDNNALDKQQSHCYRYNVKDD